MSTEEINKQFPVFQRIITGVKTGSEGSPSTLSRQWILLFGLTTPLLILAGYLLCYFAPPQLINQYAVELLGRVDSDILIFIFAGFTAQMIDGALGMAYGVTATSVLLSFGVPPAASSASVHASEVVTSGVSGL
ncbi:MAG: sulfite exporter TauE/SafE family protein, partial [Acidobacteriota bacterium]